MSRMKRFFCGAALAVLLVLAGFWVLRQWIDLGSAGVQVACLYTPQSAWALPADDTVASLQAAGIAAQAECADNTPALLALAREKLDQGATMLVLSLDESPTDRALLLAADAADADLFFVGAYPGDSYLASYDKAYYVGSRTAYAGELMGQATALGYRNGAIADANGNLLLDYLWAGDNDDGTVLNSLLEECEHYGVYPQTSLYVVAEADADSAEAADSAADSEAEEALASPAPDPDTLAGQWSKLSTEPELIACLGLDALTDAQAYAESAGWLARQLPVRFAALVETRSQARQAAESGCATVVYYDGDEVSRVVVQMVQNLTLQSYIAGGTGLSPDAHGALWVPYQLYCSAEDLPPQATAAPEADSAASASAAE